MSVKASRKTLPAKTKDSLAPFKDHYVLDFLGLKKAYSEEEMRKSILANLRDFFLEFGRNFTFVGEEYSLRVGDETYRIDLLFSWRAGQGNNNQKSWHEEPNSQSLDR